MAKLLVKNSKTGETRPMTQKSYDAAGQKRGFKIVGKVEDSAGKSEIEMHMDRLKAEKAAKMAAETVSEVETESGDLEESGDESAEPEIKERKKPGPKPKNPAA